MSPSRVRSLARRFRDFLQPPKPSPTAKEGSAVPSPPPSAPSPQPAMQDTNSSTPFEERMIKDALSRLSLEDRKVLEDHSGMGQVDGGAALHAVMAAATKKREEWENNRWTFTIGRYIVAPRYELDKVIGVLDRIKAIGDAAASLDPVHAGLPWAGVRLLLEVLIV